MKTGDTVRFLNETGEGRILSMKGKTAIILTGDGFEIPFPVDQLVPVKSTPVMNKAGSVQTTTGNQQKFSLRDILYTVFVPENEEHTRFHLYISNNSSYPAYYTFSEKKQNLYTLLHSGEIEKNEKIIICKKSLEEINRSPEFRIEAIFFRDEPYTVKFPVSKMIKVDTKKLMKHGLFIANPYFEQESYFISLEEDEKPFFEIDHKSIERSIRERQSQKTTHVPKSKPKEELEVDLHIEELTDNISGMSNGQMMELQLRHVEQAIEQAIAQGIRRVILIHGVGTGKLKQEIRNLLNSYEGIKIQDASYKKYGWGATEVQIW